MDNIVDEERKRLLIDRKNELVKKRDRSNGDKRSWTIFSFFIMLVGILLKPTIIFLGIAGPEEEKILILLSILFFYVGFSMFLLYSVSSRNSYEADLQEVENELELLSIALSSEEERAEKLFKHHHIELKKYYDENLKQSSWIFVVGILCIAGGFGIITFTLYLLYNNLSSPIENKIIIASMGAVGAILTNFIAVVFLKMHAETIKSLTEFHNRFVNTHHLYFGNFLVARVKDETKREEALINLALSINANENSKNNISEREVL